MSNLFLRSRFLGALHRRGMVPGLLLTLTLAAPGAGLAEEPNPERNAYFGETHLHTSWSPDAWPFGNRVTGPADAYKYAKGETIKHPLGYDIKITTPLDFMGVTDHSEYVGITKLVNTPGSAARKVPEVQGLIMTDPSRRPRSAHPQNLTTTATIHPPHP